MKQFLFLSAALLVLGSAGLTYQINYRVQEAENRVAKLVRSIDKERETLGVLGAEWAYLNRPERLRALANTYYTELRLTAVDTRHFMALKDVPARPLVDDINAALQQISAQIPLRSN